MALPAADTKTFQEIIFPELQREEAQALIHQYNKVGKLAAYKQELYLWLIERETNFFPGSVAEPEPSVSRLFLLQPERTF